MPTSSGRWNPLALAFGGTTPREMPRFIWWCWIVLCGLVLLNGNSIATLAGWHRQFFSLPLLALCVAVLFGLHSELIHIRRSPANWVYIFAFGFLSVALLSALTSPHGNPDRAWEDWGVFRYGTSLLLISTGFCAATRAYAVGRVDAFLKLLFWLCTIAAISGYVLAGIPGIEDYLTFQDDEGRLQGVFGNVNELGLQSGYPVVLGLVLSLRSRRVFWLILGGIAGAMGVLASFSKSAMLMLMLLMMLVAWEGWRARSAFPLIGGTVALMGLAAVLGAIYLLIGITHGTISLGLNAQQQQRLEHLNRLLNTGVLDDEMTTGRTSIWVAGFNVWLESPLIGCGLDTFDVVPGTGMDSHNSFLVILGESGLLGFALFVAMLWAWLTSLWRCKQGDVRVLGIGFMLAQSALWMSSGQAMSLRGHNLITGCVLGLLVMSRLPTRARRGRSLDKGCG